MDLHLNDKTALATGSTAGIDLEIARKLPSKAPK
jgi:NADP-dependent 3-hydroxy acid dehydrogenase YdfG